MRVIGGTGVSSSMGGTGRNHVEVSTKKNQREPIGPRWP